MVNSNENGISKPNLNSDQGSLCLLFTNILGKGMNLFLLPSTVSKIAGQTGLSGLCWQPV